MRSAFLRVALALLISIAGSEAAGAQLSGDVEAGIRAYLEEGDPRETIRQIGGALDAGTVATTARPRAHLYIAHAFLALGDTVSALPHIDRALAAQPCIRPSEELTPPAWMALWEGRRPEGAACGSRLAGAFLRSAVLPGWGQRYLGREDVSVYFFGATLGATAGVLLLDHFAESRYNEYVSSTDAFEVPSLYSSAERLRRSALVVGGIASGLYLWNLVDAALAGAAEDRATADVRSLSFTPSLGVSSEGGRFAVRLVW